MTRLLFGRGVEVADPRVALFFQSRPRGKREFFAALVVELSDLRNALQLRGVGPHQIAKLIDLETRKLPRAGVDVATSRDVFIEHKAGERGFGLRHVRADVTDDQRDLV